MWFMIQNLDDIYEIFTLKNISDIEVATNEKCNMEK